jgi:hypothetical protein
MSGTGGGGGIILAQVKDTTGPSVEIPEHAFRQMLQAIRHVKPALYASLAALINDPTP